MRILLADADPACLAAVEKMLEAESFSIVTTDLADEIPSLARHYPFDAILMDVILKGGSGYDAIRTLRANTIGVPILILSGLAGIEDKVKGLRIGADDYMTKPFHKDELIARLHAIVRRAHGFGQSVLTYGPLEMNLHTKSVKVHGRVVDLTGKEHTLLELFMMRQGDILTKEVCLDHLYGGLNEPNPKIVDTFVCKLRRKLTKAAEDVTFIDTIWGRGYRMPHPDALRLNPAITG